MPEYGLRRLSFGTLVEVDVPPLSNRSHYPDAAHEQLAQWVEEVVAGLQEAIDQLAATRTEVGNQSDRITAVTSKADTALSNTDALKKSVADLDAKVNPKPPKS